MKKKKTELTERQRRSTLKPELYLRRALGFISKIFSPGYSFCMRCGITWKFVKGHSTSFTKTDGCFPLCEYCWNILETPENRLPYYKRLFNEWKQWGEQSIEKWDEIKKAILEGR